MNKYSDKELKVIEQDIQIYKDLLERSIKRPESILLRDDLEGIIARKKKILKEHGGNENE